MNTEKSILNKKNKIMPYYLKDNLPDHRFLEFRLFIHNRKVNEVQHDLKFFESMYSSSHPKKTFRNFSAYKRNSIYNKKKKKYIDTFTNGDVNIECFKNEENTDNLRKHFENLKTNQAYRLNVLIDKALRKKKKKIEESMRRPATGFSSISSTMRESLFPNKRLNSS